MPKIPKLKQFQSSSKPPDGPAKRKKVVLTVAQKIEILNALEGGASAVSLAIKFDIGKSTITGIKRDELKIREFYSATGADHRKSTRGYDALDADMINWVSLKRSQNVPISGHMI